MDKLDRYSRTCVG